MSEMPLVARMAKKEENNGRSGSIWALWNEV